MDFYTFLRLPSSPQVWRLSDGQWTGNIIEDFVFTLIFSPLLRRTVRKKMLNICKV